MVTLQQTDLETTSTTPTDAASDSDAHIADDSPQLVRGVMYGLAFSMPIWLLVAGAVVALR